MGLLFRTMIMVVVVATLSCDVLSASTKSKTTTTAAPVSTTKYSGTYGVSKNLKESKIKAVTQNDTASTIGAWRLQRRKVRKLPEGVPQLYSYTHRAEYYTSNSGGSSTEPQFSSSNNYQVYHSAPDHLRADATSDGYQKESKKCRYTQKPMPSYNEYSRGDEKRMMTCYVCGDTSGYGAFSENCDYSPGKDVYAQTTSRHYTKRPFSSGEHYKGSPSAHNERAGGGSYDRYSGYDPHSGSYDNYERETPEATHSSRSYNDGDGGHYGAMTCKIVYKDGMKCKMCKDEKYGSAFSEDCGFDSKDPGSHQQRSYDYSNVNEKKYRSPYNGGDDDGSYRDDSDDRYSYSTPDRTGSYGSGSSYNRYERPSYNDDGGYAEPQRQYDSYSKPRRAYNEDDGSYSSSSDDYRDEGKDGAASNVDSQKNKNCKTMYKPMESYSPYSKNDYNDKIQMKCEVCVKSDGYGGVTEECNYSGGGETIGSYPGPVDMSSFFGPNSFYGGNSDFYY